MFIQAHAAVESLRESFCGHLDYQLPPTSVAVPANESHVYFQVNSYFNSTHSANGHDEDAFAYPIEFSITSDAYLDAAITYSLFSNAFVLELYRADASAPGGWAKLTVGDFSTVGLEQGDVSNYLGINLYRSRATKYRVIIGTPGCIYGCFVFSHLCLSLCLASLAFFFSFLVLF
jgi:hypothetical protein